jgi:hypothetical protein
VACRPILTTNSSYQITHCTNFNGIESLLGKNIAAIKMKENGWVVGVLWGFEPFPHGNHHIRDYMHHVCLIQSISARKVAHIKLGTCSGSSQCQLQLGTKMVSIGWSGYEWLPSECKNAHFQAFPPLAPSVIFLSTFTSFKYTCCNDR